MGVVWTVPSKALDLESELGTHLGVTHACSLKIGSVPNPRLHPTDFTALCGPLDHRKG